MNIARTAMQMSMYFFEHGKMAKYSLSLLMTGGHPQCENWYALNVADENSEILTKEGTPLSSALEADLTRLYQMNCEVSCFWSTE